MFIVWLEVINIIKCSDNCTVGDSVVHCELCLCVKVELLINCCSKLTETRHKLLDSTMFSNSLLALLTYCLAVYTALGEVVFLERVPKITREIWPEIKRIGMTGYLNCTVSAQGNNKVQWIHKETSTVLTSDDRVEVDNVINEVVDGYTKYDVQQRVDSNELTTYMLVVRRLTMADSGNYTCQVVVKATNEHPAKTGELVVLRPPTIHPGYFTQVVNVMEGENATLTCIADGFPKPNISWIRVSGNPLPPPWDRFQYRGNVFTAIHMSYADRGFYRCIADNNVRPPAAYDALVLVHFAPQARAVQKTYGQAQNRLFDLTIECIVAGYPEADMKWYHVVNDALYPVIDDDKHIINQLLSHGQVLQLYEVWYQLTIINIQANDYGVYICEGTNKYGSSRLELSVYETSECQGPNCPPEGGFVTSVASLAIPHLMTSLLSLLLLCVACYKSLRQYKY